MAKHSSAKRHAEAVFQLALKEKEVDKWREELKTVYDVIGDPQLSAVLEDPKFRFSDKKRLIDKCIPDVNSYILKLIYLLVSKQRLGLLEQIVEEYNRMADMEQGIEHAIVTTAVPVDKAEIDRISKYLAERTGKKIIVTTDVDPEIIGGFVARIGDKLIDGSTRAKLEALKKQLMKVA